MNDNPELPLPAKIVSSSISEMLLISLMLSPFASHLGQFGNSSVLVSETFHSWPQEPHARSIEFFLIPSEINRVSTAPISNAFLIIISP